METIAKIGWVLPTCLLQTGNWHLPTCNIHIHTFTWYHPHELCSLGKSPRRLVSRWWTCRTIPATGSKTLLLYCSKLERYIVAQHAIALKYHIESSHTSERNGLCQSVHGQSRNKCLDCSNLRRIVSSDVIQRPCLIHISQGDTCHTSGNVGRSLIFPTFSHHWVADLLHSLTSRFGSALWSNPCAPHPLPSPHWVQLHAQHNGVLISTNHNAWALCGHFVILRS